jgi:dTDP-4-amino-4,6-dideoxygalactose transaminase
MLKAISRYGIRVLPNTRQLIAACRRRRELVRGPQIGEFEEAFARYHNWPVAGISASYGRMAFYYILKALAFPPGSEILFPALTFWVVPEIARVAGLRPVFVDVDPVTFNIDVSRLEEIVTPRTRAVVATHLYGLPCDMDRILAVARRYNLTVIEDCAHALGARYRGRPVGTLGDAAFFSFQTLKPLNTYGGGMALVRDAGLARKVRAFAEAEPWPDERRVLRRLWVGRLQRVFVRPSVFRFTAFPWLWAASFVHARPDVYLWEPIRSLAPLPKSYRERYSNVQAVLGLAGLERLDEWNAATRRHAELLTRMLSTCRGLIPPAAPSDRTHVYYQYCVYVPNREQLVRDCIRRGLDLETLHVDVCPNLNLFAEFRCPVPGAEKAALAVQVPVSCMLTRKEVEWVARVVKRSWRRQAIVSDGGCDRQASGVVAHDRVGDQ